MLGAGTQSNPYLVSTPQDLNSIRNNLTAYYELTNDIDMSGWGNFTPIATTTANRFEGFIDGKGYKIINLNVINNAEYSSLIGIARGDTLGGYIKNLGLENVYVESNTHHLAGLVGLNYKVAISNCFVTGIIKTTNTSSLYTGGLVGRQYGLIENCFTHCSVTGGTYTGGFVGYMSDNTSILKKNYSKSTASGKANLGAFYGGLNTNAGYKPILENNFFDSEFAGTTNLQTTGVTAKTSSEMKTQSTYTNWDFETVWYMEDYPALRMFSNIPAAKKETVTVSSFVNLLVQNLDDQKKSTKQLQSYSVPIQTAIQRNTATLRSISTYLSQLETNATKFSRSVRSSTANVTSFISPIGSYAYRESKTVRNLIARIKPLESDISVSVPLNVFTPNAYVTIVENSSRASKLEGMSKVYYVRNPSSVSEVINVSEGHVIKNPSRVEVMK